MAIYHLEAKIVSRGAGRSAVAAAAYLSCSRMLNEYDGVQHDYTRKQGLGWRQVFLPATATTEWQDRENLWNAVEETETAKDSRLAREFVAALPIELSREEQIQLLQDFIKEQFVADGMCADAAIHDPYPPGHNPHAHILLTVRPLDEKGKWQYKTEKEYLCVKDGEERGFTAAEFKQAQADGWEKQYQYKVGKRKVYMTPSAAQAQGYERVSKYPKSTKDMSCRTFLYHRSPSSFLDNSRRTVLLSTDILPCLLNGRGLSCCGQGYAVPAQTARPR